MNLTLPVLSKRIGKWFIRERIYLAVGSVLTVASFSILLDTKFDFVLASVIFFTVLYIYCFNLYTDLEEDLLMFSRLDIPTRKDKFNKKAKTMFLLGESSLIVALILSLFKNVYFFLFILAIILLGFLYTAESLPKRFGMVRLKEIPAVKNLTIAFGVSSLFIFSLIFSYSLNFSNAAFVLLVFMFFRVLIGSIIADIGDMRGDKLAGIRTIPIKYGVKKTKYILFILNFFLCIFFPLSIYMGYLSKIAVFPGLTILFTFPLIWKSNRHNANKFSILSDVNDTYILFLLTIISGSLWQILI